MAVPWRIARSPQVLICSLLRPLADRLAQSPDWSRGGVFTRFSLGGGGDIRLIVLIPELGPIRKILEHAREPPAPPEVRAVAYRPSNDFGSDVDHPIVF